MPEELVSVRYIVDDVERAVAFYREHFGFELRTSAAPAFADVVRGRLRLLLSGPASSAGRPMPDGPCSTTQPVTRSSSSSRPTVHESVQADGDLFGGNRELNAVGGRPAPQACGDGGLNRSPALREGVTKAGIAFAVGPELVVEQRPLGLAFYERVELALDLPRERGGVRAAAADRLDLPARWATRSSATARKSSSLREKCQYRAPVVTPASAGMASTAAPWNPRRAKTTAAAATSLRRVSAFLSARR